MEISGKRAAAWTSTGSLGVAAVACVGCCAPLFAPVIAPLLAWAGIAGLTATGQYVLLAAALGAGSAGMLLLSRRRRAKQQASLPCPKDSCTPSCAGEMSTHATSGKPSYVTDSAARSSRK